MKNEIAEIKKTLVEAKEKYESIDFWAAERLYDECLLRLNSLKKSDEIQKLRKICRDGKRIANLKSQDSYQSSSVDIPIPKEEIGRFVDIIFKDDDLLSIFRRITASPDLLPSFKRINQHAEENMPISYQLCSVKTVDEKGNTIKDSNDGSFAWFYKVYSFHQGVASQVLLVRVFQELDEKAIMNTDTFVNFFLDHLLIKGFSRGLISTGIERFLAEDFVSAIHILMPQFESLFLRACHMTSSEIDIVSSRNQKGSGHEIYTNTKILSEDFLDQDTVRDLWGRDLCEYIKFVFYSPMGLSIRHKVAHGEITNEECNKQSAILVLYFYIVILTRCQEIKDESPNKD